MPEIQVLSTHVADLIAAGEVVERPASVVKELTENAVDAGASVVTVEIQNGGMGLIRVTDDGKGIAPDEVETAFLRHATSKIRTEYDLDAIGTLGFRGEALAAIASVSRMEALTRREADGLGCAITLEGGVVVDKEEAGCPAGTTMMVRDLFYNTPARLKFMKKDSAEGAACLAVVQKQALAQGQVAGDGSTELRYSHRVNRPHPWVQHGASRLREQVIGRDPVQVQLTGIVLHLVHHGLHLIPVYRVHGIRDNPGQEAYENGAEQPHRDTGQGRGGRMPANRGEQDGRRQPEADVYDAET